MQHVAELVVEHLNAGALQEKAKIPERFPHVGAVAGKGGGVLVVTRVPAVGVTRGLGGFFRVHVVRQHQPGRDFALATQN